MPTRRAHAPGRPAHKDQCTDPQENGPAQLRDVSRTPRSRTKTHVLFALSSVYRPCLPFFLHRIISVFVHRKAKMVWHLGMGCVRYVLESSSFLINSYFRQKKRARTHTHTHCDCVCVNRKREQQRARASHLNTRKRMGAHNGCMLLILFTFHETSPVDAERHPLGRRRACQTSLLLIIILVEPGEPARDDGKCDVGDLRALSLLDARPKHPDGTPALERRPGGDS